MAFLLFFYTINRQQLKERKYIHYKVDYRLVLVDLQRVV